ncbi:hypothetical protein Gotur_033691 [Gossypium turneri]
MIINFRNKSVQNEGNLQITSGYCTVKVTRVAQDDCGPIGGFATYTVTGIFALILILAALLRYWCVGWVGLFYPHMVC